MRIFLPAALAGLTLASTPVRAAAEMPASGVIDVVWYWPNPQMSRTHYLKGSQGDFLLSDVHGDGNFQAFRLGQFGGGGAFDTYAIFRDSIALIASVTVEDGQQVIWQYAPPYPSFARMLDMSGVPSVVPVPVSTVLKIREGGATIEHSTAGHVYITRVDAGVRLQWGSIEENGGFEALTIGDVPIEGTGALSAPGLVRYEAPQWDIDSYFTWAPRAR